MMSPISPNPVFFSTLAASQPAIAPMTSVTIKLSIVIAILPPERRQRIGGKETDHAGRGNQAFLGLRSMAKPSRLAGAIGNRKNRTASKRVCGATFRSAYCFTRDGEFGRILRLSPEA